MYYTTQEVATMFKVTVQTIQDWIAAGKLPAVKIGRSYRITDEDIKILVETGKRRGSTE